MSPTGGVPISCKPVPVMLMTPWKPLSVMDWRLPPEITVSAKLPPAVKLAIVPPETLSLPPETEKLWMMPPVMPEDEPESAVLTVPLLIKTPLGVDIL